MAIVIDERWLRTAYEATGLIVHGEIKTYPLADFEAARTWVSAPLAADT